MYLEYIQIWLREEEVGNEYMFYDANERKIKFMLINLRGNVEWEEPYMVKKPEYDNWEHWVQSFN